MISKTVTETILDVIAAAGVRHVFGIVGDAINPLVDAIRRDDRIDWIHMRHEEAGAFAASAQAKLTGRLAVCAGTVGPGAIHLLNGLYDAKKDHAPVLALTGQVPRAEIGSDYHQEVDLDALFADVCLFNETIHVPEQMPRLAVEAVQAALAGGGVAHLSIPSDIGPQPVTNAAEPNMIFQLSGDICPAAADLQKAAELLNNADKVGILCGIGCRDAAAELLEVAELLAAPVAYSLRGKAIVDHDHPYWVGATGLIGSPAGMHAVEDADVLLMVGTNFPYRNWLPHGKPVIQIDIRAEHLGKRVPLAIGLVGHARATLAALKPLLRTKRDRSFLKSIQERKKQFDCQKDREADLSRDADLIHPQAIAAVISEVASKDAVFCVDTGEVTVWAAHHLRLKHTQEMLASFNLASMAFAMPGAIGAQLVDRRRQVVALCGDGGFSMLMGDLITAVNYDLPITMVIFNNGKLGLVKMEMEVAGYPEYGTTLKNPNFADIARVCGAGGIRVESPKALRPAIEEAINTPRPFVVDVVCSGDELTIPPRIEFKQAWGYSLAKIREFLVPSDE
ncbi:MAG: pyruvate dehydrogenase [Gemmatales bacterium]|nr:MAG: pyruvate dehydrogenase [Gemmatales bacterium]